MIADAIPRCSSVRPRVARAGSRISREQQRKKELARKVAKRKRMFKVAGAWLGVIFIGFLAAAWFSPALINWLHTR